MESGGKRSSNHLSNEVSNKHFRVANPPFPAHQKMDAELDSCRVGVSTETRRSRDKQLERGPYLTGDGVNRNIFPFLLANLNDGDKRKENQSISANEAQDKNKTSGLTSWRPSNQIKTKTSCTPERPMDTHTHTHTNKRQLGLKGGR